MTTALKTLISEAKKAVKPSERFILLDNGGETADRYTLFDTKPTGYEGDEPSKYVHQYVGFDENPSSPQGFGQHGDITQAQFAAHKKEKFRSLGKKIKLDDLDAKARAFADDFIRDSLKMVTEATLGEQEGESYTTLKDAAWIDKRYGSGNTSIWYAKKFTSNPDPNAVDVTRLRDTHVLVGNIKSKDREEIFGLMQGEQWSPEGEARSMIQKLGLSHTSMSVGDIISINDMISDTYMVSGRGFILLQIKKVAEGRSEGATPKGQAKNKKVWAWATQRAKADKKWADTHEYKDNPDVWPEPGPYLDTLQKRFSQSVEDLALEHYRYLYMRAHSQTRFGALDQADREKWEKISGEAIDPEDYLKTTSPTY